MVELFTIVGVCGVGGIPHDPVLREFCKTYSLSGIFLRTLKVRVGRLLPSGHLRASRTQQAPVALTPSKGRL